MRIIDSVSFGEVIVKGKSYHHDVVIYWDGTTRKRDKEPSKKYKSLYGHTPLSREEIEKYLKEGVEVVVIGTGIYGALPIMEGAKKLLEEKGISYVTLPSPKAIERFNELVEEGKKVLGIIHITC
ncbi:hypothetical protein IPA_06175 [Ignicoccus pacificus DSM 13166]|uniref:Uncharacterized protein n=1 Tax=Ignicoccus pacificus DSM 13166 TaxID=940294 RepID=A0A977KAT9_9CREN|nr:hypothetical protein IPA_06175 [Ignicoccus pacificus DSM 13166]